MRARNIKPGFFKNDCLGSLSIYARYLFAGLWCLADREGRLEDRPQRIKAEIFPYEKVNVEELLAELAQKNGDHPFILRYQVDGRKYIQVVNFTKHQKPHRNEQPSVIPPPPEVALEKNSEEFEKNTDLGHTKDIPRSDLGHTKDIPWSYQRRTLARTNRADSLILRFSDSPDSLIADSLKGASPNGEAQRLLRAPPSPGDQKRTQKNIPQLEDAFSEVPPPQREEASLGVPPPQPEEAFLGVPPPERARPSQPTRPPQPDKAQRSLRSPPHPAVEAYKKAFFYYPRRNLYSLIAEKVGDEEEDLRLWAKACQSWAAHGWNPRNIAGLLEYYEKRGFLEKTTISRGIPKFSRAAQAAIALAEKYEREEQDEKDEGKEKDRAEEGDEGLSSFFKAFTPSPISHPP